MLLRKNATGEQHPQSKLRNEERGRIQERLDSGEKQSQLAREYQVSQPLIFKIYWGPDYRQRR